MSEPETFLSRWFRRKRQAAEAGDDAAAPQPASESGSAPPDVAATGVAPPDVAALEALVERRARDDGAPPSAAAVADAPAATPFDPATLPPIESITAATDIRAFLLPGVPQELALAALRRAWSADPAIRDFVGLADYAWDYHAPGSMAGFGPLEMTDELRQMVARIMGQAADGEGAPPAAVAPADSREPAPVLPDPAREGTVEIGADAPAARPGTSQNCDESPPDEKHAAAQHAPEKDEDLQSSIRRSHGGALPK